MPLEFAMASYRLGHSMIRPGYRLAESPAKELLFSIFQGETGGLRGFQRLDRKRGIDWSLFFHATLPAGQPLDEAGRAANNAKIGPDGMDQSSKFPHRRTQFGCKIDTMLVDPIAHLPDVVAPGLLPDDPDRTCCGRSPCATCCVAVTSACRPGRPSPTVSALRG